MAAAALRRRVCMCAQGGGGNMASQRMEPQQLFLPEPGVSHNMIAPSASLLSKQPLLHSSNVLINKQGRATINDLREGTKWQGRKKKCLVYTLITDVVNQ